MNRWLLAFVAVLASMVLWPTRAHAQARCPYAVSGTVGVGDPMQTARLRNGQPSTCQAPKAVPALVQTTASFRYESHTLRNRSRAAQCVTVSMTASLGGAHSAAYLGAFDPLNPQAGYLADSGANSTGNTVTYSFEVPALADFVVVVHGIGKAGATYDLSVADCGAVVVTSITPNAGPVGGGTPVTIKGSGFLANPSVSIGAAANDVVVVDEATITATTPAQPAGAVDVIVTNTDATSSTLEGAFTFVPPAGTTLALASSANPSVFGQPVLFTATATSGAGTPAGAVTFRDGATSIGSVALDATGKATLTVSNLNVGPHAITADYPGDATFAAATSAVLTQTVNVAGTTTAVASSANPSALGAPVVFTATVAAAPSGAGTPTGAVLFKDGTVELGTGTLDATGKATLTTSELGVGAHSVTATYAGDGRFATSVSPPLVQEIGAGVTDAGADAGAGEEDAGYGGSSGGVVDAGPADGGAAAASTSAEGGGCDCREAPASRSGAPAVALLLGLGVALARRARRR